MGHLVTYVKLHGSVHPRIELVGGDESIGLSASQTLAFPKSALDLYHFLMALLLSPLRLVVRVVACTDIV
jgi:hypothetical protein